MLNNEQIRENRKKAAKFLQTPELEKHERCLESSVNPNKRCCLGHLCHYFKMHRSVEDGLLPTLPKRILYDGDHHYAPKSLVNLLGMWDEDGSVSLNCESSRLRDQTLGSLADLNDETELTTQEIGKLMEDWIEGGVDTPFKPLTLFPTV